MSAPCVLIMAGGTGGHVFPALAAAAVFRQQGFEVQWLGTARGIESRLVPEAGIRLHCLNIAGLRGKGIKALLLGDFRGIRSQQVFDILASQMDIDFPVLHSPYIGHVANKITLPVGAEVSV